MTLLAAAGAGRPPRPHARVQNSSIDGDVSSSPSLQPPREKTTVVFCFAAALVVDVRRGRARLDARRQPWRPVASRAVRVPQGQAVAHSLATWRIFRLRSCCYATLLLFPSFVCLD